MDRLFERIPLVKGLFNTFKQIAGVFGNGHTRSFERVVVVDFPQPGSLALAFVTGDAPDADYLSVYVPTTPNPTSGFLLFIRRAEVSPVDITVEEAIKLIVSCGAIVSVAQIAAITAARPDGGDA